MSIVENKRKGAPEEPPSFCFIMLVAWPQVPGGEGLIVCVGREDFVQFVAVEQLDALRRVGYDAFVA